MKAEWLAQWMPRLTADDNAAVALPRDLGSAAHGGRGQHDHHPRRGQPARPALAVLGATHAADLHRLGQDHPARLRPRPRDGRQARPARQALHQRLGRRGHRLHRHGLRDRGARAHPDPVDPAQQLLDGHRAEDHEDGHREVPLDRHQRQLRGHGEGVRRLRRARDRARRDHPRASSAASAKTQRGRARPCSSSSPRRRSTSRSTRTARAAVAGDGSPLASVAFGLRRRRTGARGTSAAVLPPGGRPPPAW